MHRFAKSTLLGLSLTAIFFTTATLAFTADVQKNEQAIREVMTGKRDVARAAWWGYDEKDATAALQAAIDSGAKKVIIEKMPGPWIVDKIKLVGDQELFFEPGVVIEAKKGAFHGRADSLFSAWNDVKNLKLIGPGATLRMHRDDYDNPKEYEKAEWRHAINLHGCENVTIEGLTIAKSGGDGIYLGAGRNHAPCRNVTIRDVGLRQKLSPGDQCHHCRESVDRKLRVEKHRWHRTGRRDRLRAEQSRGTAGQLRHAELPD